MPNGPTTSLTGVRQISSLNISTSIGAAKSGSFRGAIAGGEFDHALAHHPAAHQQAVGWNHPVR